MGYHVAYPGVGEVESRLERGYALIAFGTDCMFGGTVLS